MKEFCMVGQHAGMSHQAAELAEDRLTFHENFAHAHATCAALAMSCYWLLLPVLLVPEALLGWKGSLCHIMIVL